MDVAPPRLSPIYLTLTRKGVLVKGESGKGESLH